MCENNHNRPNLALIAVLVVPSWLPKHISNNFIEFDNWFYLNIGIWMIFGFLVCNHHQQAILPD